MPNQLVLYDGFREGTPDLPWVAWPYFSGDNVQGATDHRCPSGDKGIGVLRNERAGGFAALSYVPRELPADFQLSASIYVHVSLEKHVALNGLAFRIDPEHERYYRFAAQFGAEPTLTLAYVGRDQRNFPVYLRTWTSEDIPDGTPAASAWHRMTVRATQNRVDLFWNDRPLPGGPFPIDLSAHGFAGVYATFTRGAGVAETKVDDFVVEGLSRL